MHRYVTPVVLGCLGLGLGACTSALPPEKTTALGPPFNEQLKTGYIQLAGDRGLGLNSDYFHFREKAKAALLGDEVGPDAVPDGLPPQAEAEAQALRERLTTALAASGRIKAPRDAGSAQVSFDCWLAELADDAARPAASACKETLLASLARVETVAGGDNSYEILFESGSTSLSAEARDTIQEVAELAAMGGARLRVVGYTDPSGSIAVNQRLSEERARVVAVALADAGVAADAITTEGAGEATALQSAAEGRRVEIFFAR